MTNTTLCPGSGLIGEAHNFNARGRKMHLITCSACGREFRKQGNIASNYEVIPEHAASAPQPEPEPQPEPTPVLVWADGTVSHGIDALRHLVEGQVYGFSDESPTQFWVNIQGGLYPVTLRHIESTPFDADDYSDQSYGLFKGGAQEPVVVVGVRVDGRS